MGGNLRCLGESNYIQHSSYTWLKIITSELYIAGIAIFWEHHVHKLYECLCIKKMCEDVCVYCSWRSVLVSTMNWKTRRKNKVKYQDNMLCWRERSKTRYHSVIVLVCEIYNLPDKPADMDIGASLKVLLLFTRNFDHKTITCLYVYVY